MSARRSAPWRFTRRTRDFVFRSRSMPGQHHGATK